MHARSSAPAIELSPETSNDASARACVPVVVATAAVVYTMTVARTVLGGDNGELATLAVTGGAAHPPGYPLYVLYLRAIYAAARAVSVALGHGPPASPAFVAALATVPLAVASLVVLARACRAWGASPGATGLALAAYAFSPLAWILGTHAEVFALNAVLTGGILWLSAPNGFPPSAKLAFMLGLLAGLGLANHQTIVALAPVGLWGTVRAIRGARSPAGALASAIAGFAAGLAPYAYVWFCARPRMLDVTTWTWGGVTDPASMWRYFRRGQYPDAQLSSIDHMTSLVWRVTCELDGLPIFALIALGAWIHRHGSAPVERGKATSRGVGIAMLVFAVLLAGPGFALLFNLPLRGIGGAVTERFYLLPMTVILVPCALSLDALLGPILARGAVVLGATGSIVAVSGGLALSHVRAHHRPYVEQYVENALRSTPPRAIVLGSGDHRLGIFTYAKWALGQRTDVTFVSPRMLLAPWYHARISRELGVDLVPPIDHHLDVHAVVAQLLATGRPVLLAGSFFPGAVEDRFPTYTLGTMIHVVRDLSEIPPPETLERDNQALFATFARESDPSAESTAWIDDLAVDYQRPWLALKAEFARRGDALRAAANGERARAWSTEDAAAPK